MRRRRDNDDALIFLLLMILFASSCQTYEVVTAAPVEFWLTAEAILEALVLDVWAIIDLFL